MCNNKLIQKYFIRSLKYFILLTYVTTNVDAKESNLLKYMRPTVVQFQYAGNLGLGSVGFGKISPNNKWVSYIIYGYLPEQTNGIEAHTLTLKISYQLKTFQWLGFHKTYMGLSLIRNYTENAYMKYPDCFPSGYYETPTALHASIAIGQSYMLPTKSFKNQMAVYIEVSSLDYYMYNFISNYSSLKFTDILSLSLGVTVFLNSE